MMRIPRVYRETAGSSAKGDGMITVVAARPEIGDLLDTSGDMRQVAGGFVFTEGPVWDRRASTLYFSDIRNDSRYRWSAAGGTELVARPNFIGNGMVFDRAGNLLVCEHVTSSLVRIRPDGARDIVAYHYQGRYLNSPNDVITRSDGTVWFSDPDYGRWDHAVGVARKRDLDFQGLYRVDPGGEVTLAAPEGTFEQPNGLCLSPDESELYVDDVHGVKAFTVAADGSLSDARVLRGGMGSRGFPDDDGDPDGMKCDASGNIWCTGRGGVWVMRPDGELLGVVETPEICANLAWGGPDWRTLYLCTSTTVHEMRTKVPSAPLPYH
jgi:gluconolactonase